MRRRWSGRSCGTVKNVPIAQAITATNDPNGEVDLTSLPDSELLRLVALDQVIDQVDPAIYVFKDFHPFLAKSKDPAAMGKDQIRVADGDPAAGSRAAVQIATRFDDAPVAYLLSAVNRSLR